MVSYLNQNSRQQYLGLIAEKITETLNKSEGDFTDFGIRVKETPYLEGMLMDENVSEQFLQLNYQYMSFGLINPRQVQQLLLQQGKANTPEFAKTEIAIKVDVKMVDFAIAQL
jgi:hypothetical protein